MNKIVRSAAAFAKFLRGGAASLAKKFPGVSKASTWAFRALDVIMLGSLFMDDSDENASANYSIDELILLTATSEGPYLRYDQIALAFERSGHLLIGLPDSTSGLLGVQYISFATYLRDFQKSGRYFTSDVSELYDGLINFTLENLPKSGDGKYVVGTSEDGKPDPTTAVDRDKAVEILRDGFAKDKFESLVSESPQLRRVYDFMNYFLEDVKFLES